MNRQIRCSWCDSNDDAYVRYHDTQWGVPVYDDRLLFEMLVLEGMQAGLSWLSILKKRQNFVDAFAGFDIASVAAYSDETVEQLLHNKGIVRNRLKIRAAVRNAQVVQEIQKEFGSFAEYLWAWVEHRQLCPDYNDAADIPSQTALSQEISRNLKKRGMSFVGPVIIYAYMQAVGMINDHEPECFRRAQIRAMVR